VILVPAAGELGKRSQKPMPKLINPK
jgi:hypothetical protein